MKTATALDLGNRIIRLLALEPRDQFELVHTHDGSVIVRRPVREDDERTRKEGASQ